MGVAKGYRRKNVDVTPLEWEDVRKAMKILGATTFRGFILKISSIIINNERRMVEIDNKRLKQKNTYENRIVEIDIKREKEKDTFLKQVMEKDLYKGQKYD